MLKAIVLLSLLHVIYGHPTSGTTENGVTYAKQSDGPWTVLLVIRGNRCTGSLVQKKYVVTAAHCFDELEDYKSLQNDIKIFIGEWKTGMDPDCTDDEDDNEDVCFPDKVAEIPPKRLTIHSEYLKRKGSSQKNAYDIAFIELKRPPRASKIIQSIALPSEDTCEDDPDHPLFVTGFGEVKPKHYTDKKKITYITLHDQGTCKRKLGLPFNNEKHFCGMGSNNIATCKGDSGGPIANIVDGVPTLQGVVSFGAAECGHGDTPSGFLKVACYVDWIRDQIAGVQPSERRSTTTVRTRPSLSSSSERPKTSRTTTTRRTTSRRVTTTTTESTDDIFGGDDDDPFAK